MSCSECGRTTGHLTTYCNRRVCPPCRDRLWQTREAERLLALQSYRPHSTTTRPLAPDLYNAVDIATYRPRGSVAEVWARIREEANRVAGGGLK